MLVVENNSCECLSYGLSGSITDEDGKIWEQLLGLIDCPFLALSATIGNVSHLQSWLESLETARGRTGEQGLEFILHDKRWNDLDYSTFHAEVGQGETCELRDLNPIALFSRSRLMEDRWMNLVKLVPEQLQRTLELLEQLPTPPEGLQAALEYRNTQLGVVGLPDMFGSGELSPLEQLQVDVKKCIHNLATTDGTQCQVCVPCAETLDSSSTDALHLPRPFWSLLGLRSQRCTTAKLTRVKL
jgi:hypothetical protein